MENNEHKEGEPKKESILDKIIDLGVGTVKIIEEKGSELLPKLKDEALKIVDDIIEKGKKERENPESAQKLFDEASNKLNALLEKAQVSATDIAKQAKETIHTAAAGIAEKTKTEEKTDAPASEEETKES